MKLLVTKIARTSTEAQLKELFAAHGSVDTCTLVLDSETGKSKGFAFVEMADETEANAAITALHGTRVDKNKIRVKAVD